MLKCIIKNIIIDWGSIWLFFSFIFLLSYVIIYTFTTQNLSYILTSNWMKTLNQNKVLSISISQFLYIYVFCINFIYLWIQNQFHLMYLISKLDMHWYTLSLSKHREGEERERERKGDQKMMERARDRRKRVMKLPLKYREI